MTVSFPYVARTASGFWDVEIAPDARLGELIVYAEGEIILDSITFNYTGSTQTWVVPLGVTLINVEAYGASGGRGFSGSTTSYGRGGKVVAINVPVTPGETISVDVGGAGNTSGIGDDGWPNGATGGFDTFTQPAGGGGGSSIVRRTGTWLVVAGAGGGSGGAGAAGGHGGNPGGDGAGVNGGDGGTEGAGGAGGTGGGTNGTATAGGAGANAGGFDYAGGGGGGGWGGGGGGGTSGMGGGGGCSNTEGSEDSVTYDSGVRDGHGVVTFTWNP